MEDELSSAEQQGNSSRTWLLLVLALILFVLSILARHHVDSVLGDTMPEFKTGNCGEYAFFYRIETATCSANAITEDSAYPGTLLLVMFKKLFAIFAKFYMTSACLLLLPAILIGSAALSGIRKRKNDALAFLKNRKKERIFIITISALSFLTILVIHFVVMRDSPPISDEFSYVFQSELLSHGKLYTSSPPRADFFQTLNIINAGKWYSKYTVGWPLLLAAGRIIGMPFIIGPLCAAFTIYLLYLTGKRIFNEKAGAMAAFLALISPFFFLLGGTYFAHTAAGLFTLLFLYGILRMFEEEGFFYPVLTGFAIGCLLNIRPLEAALAIAGASPLVLYLFIRSKNRRKSLGSLGMALLFLSAGAGLLMLVNRLQTGNPFLLAFTKYNPEEWWGFKAGGHTLYKGLWNLWLSHARICFWSAPFLLLFTVLSFFKKEPRSSLLIALPAAYAVFFLGVGTLGQMDIGARFFYSAFIVVLIPAAGGIVWLEEKWGTGRLLGANSFVITLAVSLFAFMICAVDSKILPDLYQKYGQVVQLTKWIENPPEIPERSIIFIREDPEDQATIFTRNHMNYLDQKNLLVLYLTPEENQKLMSMFPGHKPYMLAFNYRTGRYIIMPEMDNRITYYNYVTAAMNYWKGVSKKEKAEAALKRALELKPGDPGILLQLGNLYVSMGRHENAIEIFKKIYKIEGFEDVAYLLGRSYGETGKKDLAIKVLTDYAESTQNKYLSVKARAWAEFYSKEK